MNAKNQALELLWNGDRRPARGPQRGLTMERIVAAAIEVAEQEGLAALSMRRVATRLGVGTASLYTYLPGRTELEALMLDAIGAEDPLPHEWPGGWREKVQAWARSDWTAFRRHPWVLQLMATSPVPGPNTLRWLDSALLVLADTALTEAEKVAVVESVDAYVRGVARLQVDTDANAGDPAEADRVNEALGRLVDFTRYPALERALRAGVAPWSGDQFEFGLQRLLDGVESLIAARAAG
ncbi:TetR/AcrR family transcriptional regulator [Saccharothrix algeriensis]|uniref:AcrR family transcriptional regulator n=1 Tax=Saccharothrix algeriensis TaxID=173560 RepID=A0A8T8HYN0_9PSEU|nr:TetR/AcrR family transcriptional regulator [Saccharothrix algeriensis]MBM7809307.1 AcrR family transcriptional regulator [Saccharothrix algeriensis]QTR03652.1 TetR/AcrR family transcriptional regulator C-terminal domain-containing protein [Saccharothrix algeriensis]